MSRPAYASRPGGLVRLPGACLPCLRAWRTIRTRTQAANGAPCWPFGARTRGTPPSAASPSLKISWVPGDHTHAYPSGQRGETQDLLLSASAVRIRSRALPFTSFKLVPATGTTFASPRASRERRLRLVVSRRESAACTLNRCALSSARDRNDVRFAHSSSGAVAALLTARLESAACTPLRTAKSSREPTPMPWPCRGPSGSGTAAYRVRRLP